MSYLRLEKALMTNLQESLPREVLRTNRSGAYSCSTIVDCNTRKYHGLLVVPVPNLDDENHVLLSSMDVPWCSTGRSSTWDSTSIRATTTVLKATSTFESLTVALFLQPSIGWEALS